MNSGFFRRREEPTKQEIQQSKLLTDMQTSFKDFLSENEQAKKQTKFLQFLIYFDNFIILETNKKLVNKFVPQYVKELLQFSQQISGNVPSLIQTMKILTKTIAFPDVTIKPKTFCTLFENCCKIADLCPLIFQISDQFFRTIISDEDFFSDFVSHNYLEMMFERVFVSFQSEKSGKIFNSLLFDSLNPEMFQCVNFMDIINFISNIIGDDKITSCMAENVSLFIANLFKMVSLNGKQITKFFQSNSFIFFDYIVQRAPFENRADCYRPMLAAKNEDGTPAPNINVYKHINTLFNENPLMQKPFFMLVCELVQNNATSVLKLDQAVPMQNWFNWATPSINDLVMLLAILDSVAPSLIKKCLPVLFKGILHDKTCKVESILLCASVIEHQISEKLITYSYLLETNFLSAFVIEISHENVQYILSQCASFKQLIIDVYSLDGSKSFRPSVFKAILEVCADSLVSSVTCFLAVDPSEMCIRILLDHINKTKKLELLQALIGVFVSSSEAAENFVRADGIKWAFDKLGVEDMSELFASLVCTRRFDELEDAISKLPENHPLFSQSEEILEKIVFGLSRAQCRPIRVHSLVHLLKKNIKLDPYNSWLLGSSFIEQTLKSKESIFDVPMLDQIANRLLDQKYLEPILQRPYELEKFCNPNYDHFPLFQFYPGNSELTINSQCIALSFWFRFNEDDAQAHNFFRTNVIQLSLQNKRLSIRCDDNKEELNVEPTKWHFIAMKFDSSLMSSALVLYVNDRIYTFQLKTKRNAFTCIYFGAASKSLCFLGSAIRLINSQPKEFNTLYHEGPSFIVDAFSEETIITPNNVSLNKQRYKVPANCVCVPYFGFPMHFISYSHIRTLLKSLEQAPDQQKFESIFHTLLNIQEITKHGCPRFYQVLSESLTHCIKFLTKSVFVDFLVSSSKANKSCDALSGIIFNKKIWESFDNTIVISSVLERFSDSDLKTIPSFEIFLVKKILDNDGNQEMVNSVLKKAKTMKPLLKYILALVKTCPTNVQRNILEALTNFITKENVELFVKTFSFRELTNAGLVVDTPSKVLIMHMIAKISSFNANYVHMERSFIHVIAECIRNEEVWKDVITIVENSKRSDLYAMIIILVAIGAACSKCGEKMPMLDSTCSYLQGKMHLLLENQLCNKAIINIFPLSIHIHDYLKGEAKLQDVEVDCETISKDFFSSQERIWSSVEKIAKTFDYSSTVLKINTIDFIRSFLPGNEGNQEIESKEFNNLISDILLKGPAHIQTAFILSYTLQNKKCDTQVEGIVTRALEEAQPTEIMSSSFVSLLQIIHALFATKPIIKKPMELLESLLCCLKKVEVKTSRILLQASEMVLEDIFHVFPKDEANELLLHLKENTCIFSEIVVGAGTLKNWLFIFSTLLQKHEKQCLELVEKIGEQQNVSKDAINTFKSQKFSIFEESWKSHYNESQKQAFNIINGSHEGIHISLYIKEAKRNEYKAESYQKAYQALLNATFDSLSNEFLVYEEIVTWESLRYKLDDEQSNVERFNHSSYFLTSKCFPYSYPKLLSPFPFLSRGDGFRVYSTTTSFQVRINNESTENLIKLFIKIYGKKEQPQGIHQAKIIRYNEQINCVVFVFSESIEVLTFASYDSEKNALVLQSLSSPQLPSFIDEVLIGEWGKTNIFAGRIVINITFNDILFISNAFNEGTTFCFWCLDVGCFQLRFQKQESSAVSYKLNKISAHVKDLLPPTQLLCNIKTKEEAFEKYEAGFLSCMDTVLILNALSNHYFIDPSNMLQFPFDSERDASSLQTFAEKSYEQRIKAFYEFEKTETPEKMLSFASNKLGLTIEQQNEKPSNAAVNPIIKQHIGLINKTHVFAKLSHKPKGELIYDFDEIIDIPKLTLRIECTRNYVISIDKTNMTISIINNKTKSVAYKSMMTNLIYVTGFNVSHNGLLLVIDYSYCISRTFRIIYNDGVPCNIEQLSTLSLTKLPRSMISGTESVCCTIQEGCKNLIIWSALTGHILHNVEFEETITNAAIDEYSNIIWCSTARNIHIITINGVIVISRDLPCSSSVSFIKVVPIQENDFHRTAFIGFDNGRIYCSQFIPEISHVAMKAMESPHTAPIRSIVIHSSLTSFISIDEENKTCVCYAVGLRAPRIKQEHYSQCQICNSIPSEYCNTCNRLLCKKCCPSGTCIFCQAESLYI